MSEQPRETLRFLGLSAHADLVECPLCFAAVPSPTAQAHYDWHVTLGKQVGMAGGPLGFLAFSEGRPL